MNQQLLLCTFCDIQSLDETIQKIISTYSVLFDTIYVLENTDSPNSFCCTYNVDTTVPIAGEIPATTISLHRKKISNTLYTINALNLLIVELNNGKMDKNFKINWQDYNNTILVSAYQKLKKIKTKLNKKIRVSELNS